MAATYAMVMLSLVLLTGYSGQISLAQYVFFGLGAFAMGKVAGGGKMVALETSPAPENVIKPFSTAYIKYVVPQLSRLITGDSSAYEYLSATTRGFLMFAMAT